MIAALLHSLWDYEELEVEEDVIRFVERVIDNRFMAIVYYLKDLSCRFTAGRLSKALLA